METENLDHQLAYIEEVKQILLDQKGIEEYAVFLYGSRARGSHHRRSDIDIGVLGKQEMDSFLKADLEQKLEDSNVPVFISLVDFYRVDKAFKQEALKNIQIWNCPNDIQLY
ncbi:nucleotidyltransferase family protein [Solitalea koreensis]|uniref:Predicted nucleotidyltransferase n=1 Tax=Solitalea koreensis TaxID=543615 RepID=A0A521CP12_9SPHI|nr:nucleotidyltransferase domain-containing protein [Solitalea koreensis]SMO61194.1 Predicted nucleotidyltransferase [Solitalea koreensis]